MTRVWMGRGLALVLLPLAVLCWRLGAGRAGDAAVYAQLVSVRFHDARTAADYDTMLQLEETAAEPLDFALWTQRGGAEVKAPALGRSAVCGLLTARGDTRLILPGAAVLAMDDTAGCLLDRSAALALFGTENVAGQAVVWGGRTYGVRGVVDAPGPLLVVQAAPADETPLDAVTMSGAGREGQFLLRHGIDAAHTVYGSNYARLAAVLAALPGVTAALLVLAAAAGLRRHWQEYPLRRGLLSLAWAVLLTGSLLLLVQRVPAEYLPGRWSDFEFWSSQLRAGKSGLLRWFAAEKRAPDLAMLRRALGAAWGFTGSLSLLGAVKLGRWWAAPARRPLPAVWEMAE